MRKFGISLVAAGALLVVALPSQAHHSVATFFQLEKTVEVKGVVKEFRLVNPHMRMVLEVTRENGEKEKWTLTGGVTGDLRAAGWSPESIALGDVVTVSGPPARNAAFKGMYVRKLVKADGTTLEQRVRD
jgi:Family of unknown function (DUF6152)